MDFILELYADLVIIYIDICFNIYFGLYTLDLYFGLYMSDYILWIIYTWIIYFGFSILSFFLFILLLPINSPQESMTPTLLIGF